MEYTFCIIHLELKCTQKVHIFVLFSYSKCVAWVFFEIYTFCIHLYTFCVVPVLHTLIWTRNAYRKYASRRICFLHLHSFGFNVMYTFCIQNIDCNLLNQHNNCIQKLYKVYTFLEFLKVLRFSLPVPVVGPSADFSPAARQIYRRNFPPVSLKRVLQIFIIIIIIIIIVIIIIIIIIILCFLSWRIQTLQRFLRTWTPLMKGQAQTSGDWTDKYHKTALLFITRPLYWTFLYLLSFIGIFFRYPFVLTYFDGSRRHTHAMTQVTGSQIVRAKMTETGGKSRAIGYEERRFVRSRQSAKTARHAH